jgi:DNA mismatch repair ATPase MutS
LTLVKGQIFTSRAVSPSASLDEITARLDLVTDMLSDPSFRQDLINLLRMTFDTWRLLQKFSFGKGIPDDLISLARTIQSTVQIKQLLEHHIAASRDGSSNATNSSIDQLIKKLELGDAISLSEKILQAIDEDKLSEQHSLEDDEAVATVHMAERVLRDAGEDDKLPGIPHRVRSKLSHESKEKDSETPEEVWIMRTT